MSDFPEPTETAVNAPMLSAWRERAELVLQQCQDCGKLIYYPRPICPYCWSAKLRSRVSTGRGRVETFSIVYRAVDAAFESESAVVLAEIKMDEGVCLISRIVCDDPSTVSIGRDVRLLQKPASDQYPLPVFALSPAG